MNESNSKMTKKAIILFSGGLDSTTCLAIAKSQGFDCYALSFSYGQKHSSELEAAQLITRLEKTHRHKIVNLDLGSFGGSALTDDAIDIPTNTPTSIPTGIPAGDAATETQGIPVTYVPARNTIFLSIALAWAEVVAAEAIFIGVNAVDYSGYPDCRPAYIQAFQSMADLATKTGVEGNGVRIKTPLINLTKAEIIQLGNSLAVDYSQTVSCYRADAEGRACGKCDSCRIRALAFDSAKMTDPTRYVNDLFLS